MSVCLLLRDIDRSSHEMTLYRDLPRYLPDPLSKSERRLVLARMIQAIQQLETDIFSVHDLITSPLLRNLAKKQTVSKYLGILSKYGYIEFLYRKRASFYRRKEKIFSIKF